MREIKFRIWCKQTEEMHTVERMGFEEGELWYVEDEDRETQPPYFMDRNDSVLMQYTGLKDKNGREIYEDDILKGVSNQHTTVIFDEGCYGVSPLMRVSFHNDVKKPLFMTLRSTDIHEIEVIGNIYENPELTEGN